MRLTQLLLLSRAIDILGINNLVGLDSLVKLKLDNNKIWKIQNLDHLVNLQWLGAKPPRRLSLWFFGATARNSPGYTHTGCAVQTSLSTTSRRSRVWLR